MLLCWTFPATAKASELKNNAAFPPLAEFQSEAVQHIDKKSQYDKSRPVRLTKSVKMFNCDSLTTRKSFQLIRFLAAERKPLSLINTKINHLKRNRVQTARLAHQSLHHYSDWFHYPPAHASRLGGWKESNVLYTQKSLHPTAAIS